MTKQKPEPYPDAFDLNQSLSQVEDAGGDIIVYARNAANAETVREKQKWMARLDNAVDKATSRFDLCITRLEKLKME